LGEDRHQFEDICNFTSANTWENINSEWKIGLSFEGLESEASKNLRCKFDLY
jgi:hypothetical protein